MGSGALQSNGRLLAIHLAAVCAVWVGAAGGQCTARWLPGPGHAGIDGRVWATLAVDPDGEGPEGEQIYAGGELSAAGETLTYGVARWDGTTWHPLGTGLDSWGTANALLWHRGELYVGGRFNRGEVRGFTGIGKWNGEAWERLDLGLNGYVYALAEFGGDVIAAGDFSGTISGVVCQSVMRWDGQRWHAMGEGLRGGSVNALTAFRGELIAGGAFTASGANPVSRIARWDGSQWQQIGTGINGGVASLAVHADTLVAGGVFTRAGDVSVTNVARWDGTNWAAMPAGLTGRVWCVHVHDGQLHVGGELSLGAASQPVVALDGSRWLPVGPTDSLQRVAGAIYSLSSSRDGLVLGGMFTAIQPNFSQNCAVLSPTGLQALPSGQGCFNAIKTSAMFERRLIVAGTSRALPQRGSNVARWDGESWDSIPLLPLNRDLQLTSLLVHDGELMVTGFLPPFHPSDVVKWNGGAWVPAGTPLRGSQLLQSVGGDAYAIARGMSLGTEPYLHSVCKLVDGEWVGIRPRFPYTTVSTVCAVELNQKLVVSGGPPSPEGSQSLLSVWNGDTWDDFAPGLPVAPKALCAFRGELVASGDFGMMDGVQTYVARWDGARWVPMPGHSTFPRALVEYHGNLYAGGYFETGGSGCGPLCRWNGVTWESVGMNAMSSSWSILHLRVHNDELIVGGQFSRAGRLVSVNLARWTDTNVPWLAEQPASATISCEEAASFQVRAAKGYESLNYAWQLNGLAIDPTDPHYSVESDKYASRLVIHAPRTADSGVYTCRASNDCASIISHPASLRVCTSDFNCDGGVEGRDIEFFFIAWENGDPRADANADGGVDSADVWAFIETWEQGC